jgi:hypothetical protein
MNTAPVFLGKFWENAVLRNKIATPRAKTHCPNRLGGNATRFFPFHQLCARETGLMDNESKRINSFRQKKGSTGLFASVLCRPVRPDEAKFRHLGEFLKKNRPKFTSIS